ncbi:MAG: aldo/keto reductase [Candidatus Aenigmarchaeota archaeon]|nr:aldo/keto reductase [Candidatus Aenigmarchaeota archaeon]
MKMPYNTLGKTSLRVSAIGFGGIPIQKIPEKQAVELLCNAYALGVNFFDTARIYGDSEKKIGKMVELLENKITKSRSDSVRAQLIIASKSPAKTYEEMQINIKESLRQLKTKYIDLYQIHQISKEHDLECCLGKNGSYKALVEAKENGIIKHIGITGHDIHVMLKAAKTGKFETIMIPYSYRNQEAEKELMPYCIKNNIGIIAMKPLEGGTVKYPTLAIKFCLTKTISTTIPGICLEKELKQDVADALKTTLSKKESELLKKDQIDKGYYCRSCGYCSVIMQGRCPQEINIMFFLRAEAYLYHASFLKEKSYLYHNQPAGYFKKHGPKKWLIDLCNAKATNPKNCTLCGHCESVCPYNLPIMRILKDLELNKYMPQKPQRIKQTPKDMLKKRVHEEMNILTRTARKNRIKQIPYINWKYRRSSNPGQKTTILSQINRIKSSDQEQLFQKLKKQMKIEHAKNLRELVMLSDYNNIVDMMRAFQEYFDKLK